MEIDAIRSKLADTLCSPEKCFDWMGILDDTNPGHYGLEDVEVSLSYEDIWVDIPARSFEFKKAELSFSARLGGSSDRNGIDQTFKLTLSGEGTFKFTDSNQKIDIEEFSVNEPLDLY